METLRYVQQFGRSKRDNLRPSLLQKYHVGHSIEVTPFRMMDFGCFASTADGLSGLLHNSEMPKELQNDLQKLIDTQGTIHVKINKFDRRTGEIAFGLEDKNYPKDTSTDKAEQPVVQPKAETKPEETPVATPAAAAVTETVVTASETAKPAQTDASKDLEPYQFTTSQPVQPTRTGTDALSERIEQEVEDIRKFLETVIKTPLSPAAKDMLRDLLQDTSVFRFTYAMQTAVDEFQADVGLQLMTEIKMALQKRQDQ